MPNISVSHPSIFPMRASHSWKSLTKVMPFLCMWLPSVCFSCFFSVFFCFHFFFNHLDHMYYNLSICTYTVVVFFEWIFVGKCYSLCRLVRCFYNGYSLQLQSKMSAEIANITCHFVRSTTTVSIHSPININNRIKFVDMLFAHQFLHIFH